MTKIYISGKITGLQEEEAEALFSAAEKYLAEKGYDVVNPLKIKHDHDLSWVNYMKQDIKALCDCSAIFMLNNWEDSKGAKIEKQLAEDLQMQILYEPQLIKPEYPFISFLELFRLKKLSDIRKEYRTPKKTQVVKDNLKDVQ